MKQGLVALPQLLALLLLAALTGSCAPALQHLHSASAIEGQEVLPLTTVVFSGNRYVAEADLGLEKPVPLMIHGNARMYLMVTHEIGERLTGGSVAKVEEYGYSAKGKGLIRVPLLRLGGRRITNIPNVPVFDYSADGESPVKGMVGVPFLIAERAAVDFSRDVLILGVRASAGPDQRLLALGYKYVPTTVDSTNRMTIRAYLPILDRTISITPSTVANALTLHRPPFAGKVAMTKDTTSTDQSPSGTYPDIYFSDGIAFEIARVKLSAPATLEDFAEYANVPESDLTNLGMLGYDWMKAHAAIIDYANRFLYFKP